MPLDAAATLRLVTGLAAIGSLLGSAEWVSLRRHFSDTGLYSWRIQQVTRTHLRRPKWLRWTAALMPPSRFVAVPLVQLLSSTLLLYPLLPWRLAGVVCLIVAGCYVLQSYRGIDGFNGGDAMAKVVMLTGGICLLSGSAVIHSTGLVFLTAQLVIAYSTPGWFRLLDVRWHDASKMLGLMRTESFGRRAVWTFLRTHPAAARAISGSIAVWEAFFICYVLLPLPLLGGVLAAGLLFHATNAAVMGLNIFPWTFVGSYPALIWTSMHLRSMIFA